MATPYKRISILYIYIYISTPSIKYLLKLGIHAVLVSRNEPFSGIYANQRTT